jgi:tol-pal system protein YbgF
MVRHVIWVLFSGVALLSSACMVTTEQFQALQQDVRSLRGDLNTLAKERGAGGQMGGNTGISRDVVVRLEELAVETRMVQGQLEETSYRLSELGQRLDETELKMARLLGESWRPGGAVPPPTLGEPPRSSSGPSSAPGAGQLFPPRGGAVLPQAPATTTPDPPVMQGSLPSPEEVYKKALSDYTKGNYDLAISGFRSYLNFFPKTTLVPNAQYWLAESYYSQRKFVDAIREFDKLVKEHQESSRVPSAMLKQGYAYLELKETGQGQAVLRELVAKFPKSREARLAQDSLDRLR